MAGQCLLPWRLTEQLILATQIQCDICANMPCTWQPIVFHLPHGRSWWGGAEVCPNCCHSPCGCCWSFCIADARAVVKFKYDCVVCLVNDAGISNVCLHLHFQMYYFCRENFVSLWAGTFVNAESGRLVAKVLFVFLTCCLYCIVVCVKLLFTFRNPSSFTART